MVDVVLLCGTSGSGKSSIASLVPRSVSIAADDFYKNSSDVGMPRWHLGQIAWADPSTLRVEELEDRLIELLTSGSTTLPMYDLRTDSSSGVRDIAVGERDALVLVEGYHALELAFRPLIKSFRPFVVYVHISKARALVRRFLRDARGRKKVGIKLLWQQVYLWWESGNYERRARKVANLVIDGSQNPRESARLLFERYRGGSSRD